MAHALHDRHEARILAIMHDTGLPTGIAAASVLSHYYGHDEIPLGAYKGPFGRDREWGGQQWKTGDYVPSLVRSFPAPVKSSRDVPEAVALYRRVLTDAADASVAIAAIGFATNLAALLRSPADATSPLTGLELVAKKVKTVVWQGGWYGARHNPKELASRMPKDEFNCACHTHTLRAEAATLSRSRPTHGPCLGGETPSLAVAPCALLCLARSHAHLG